MPELSSSRRLIQRSAGRLRGILTWIGDRIPFTIQGFAVLALAIAALEIFGYGRMDLVVFALAICAIAIVGFCLLLVLGGGLWLRHHLRGLTPERLPAAGRPAMLEAGYPNETGFMLPALTWLPLLNLDWQVVFPDHLETRRRLDLRSNCWEESIVPRRRCRTGHLIRRYTVSDVLGFCRFSWRQTTEQTLIALPQTGHVRNLPLLRSLTAEDGIPSPSGASQGDRMDIRPYVPGDSVRNIMWTVYARTRELNVRLPEKSIHHSNRTLAYLLSGPDDEAAAAVARVALESGALGEEWIFGADGSTGTAQEVPGALTLIAGSRALSTPLPYGLDSFLQAAGSQPGSHCIIFAGAREGAWVSQLRSSVARFGGRVSVVLATDGLESGPPAALWYRLLFRTDNEDRSSSVTSLGQLVAELRQFTESSLIVDRQTGLSFDQRMQRIHSG